MLNKNFNILEVNDVDKTMVIDWLNGIILNHNIPKVLLTHGDLFNEEQTYAIIEAERPPEPSNGEKVPSLIKSIVEPPPSLIKSIVEPPL